MFIIIMCEFQISSCLVREMITHRPEDCLTTFVLLSRRRKDKGDWKMKKRKEGRQKVGVEGDYGKYSQR